MLLSISSRSSQALLLTTLVALATPAAAQQPLPLKYKGPMTTPAISAGDSGTWCVWAPTGHDLWSSATV